MHFLVLKSIAPNSNYGQLKKRPQTSKTPFVAGYSLWYIKIDLSQKQNIGISFERSHKELLNALISFEIHESLFKLWTVKENGKNFYLHHEQKQFVYM